MWPRALRGRGRILRPAYSKGCERLAPLGRVWARGTGAGTGNVRFGYETLTVTLTGRTGSLILTLRSGRVPGFTSP